MPNPVITKAIDRLMRRQDLSVEDISAVLAEIMDGNASEVETAGVLVALRTKGETEEEIEGLARTMRRFATPVDAGRDDLVDTAGTGGGRPTFNVSTTAALIAAGRGLRGRQARQPLRHRAVGLGRPARGARRAHRPQARRGRAAASARSASASCSPPRTTAPRAT